MATEAHSEAIDVVVEWKYFSLLLKSAFGNQLDGLPLVFKEGSGRWGAVTRAETILRLKSNPCLVVISGNTIDVDVAEQLRLEVERSMARAALNDLFGVVVLAPRMELCAARVADLASALQIKSQPIDYTGGMPGEDVQNIRVFMERPEIKSLLKKPAISKALRATPEMRLIESALHALIAKLHRHAATG